MSMADALAAIRNEAKESAKTQLVKTTRRRSRGDVVAIHKSGGEKKLSIAKYVRGVFMENWKDAEPERDAFEKALSGVTGGGGGFLIPDTLAAELIPYQYAQEVVSQMPGVRTYPLPGDSLTWNKQTDVATAQWSGESVSITESTTTNMVGQVELKLRKCTGLVKIPNELLEDAGALADKMITDDLTRVLALKRDLAFLEGTGGSQPLGLYYHTQVLNTDLSAALTYDNLLDAEYQLAANNAGPLTGWIAHPIVVNKLRQLKDGNGNYVYVQDMKMDLAGNPYESATLLGRPIKFTTQIAITNRPSTNETWMVGGNWGEYAIGDKAGIKLKASDEAGDSFGDDQTWVRAVVRTDATPLQAKSFVRIKGINVA